MVPSKEGQLKVLHHMHWDILKSLYSFLIYTEVYVE